MGLGSVVAGVATVAARRTGERTLRLTERAEWWTEIGDRIGRNGGGQAEVVMATVRAVATVAIPKAAAVEARRNALPWWQRRLRGCTLWRPRGFRW